MAMRPIDETTRADEEYGPLTWGEQDLVEHFTTVSAQVRALVPTCVGMSVALREHGVTITLVADGAQTSLLDAVRYVDGGPLLQEPARDDPDHHLTVDEEWRLYSASARDNGIEATLSLPAPPWEKGPALTFTLYGSTQTTFAGHHEELADLLGAWADGALVDADLAFSSRELARRAPGILQEAADLAVVAGLLAQTRRLDPADAEQRLRHAAARAGLPLARLLAALRGLLVGLYR